MAEDHETTVYVTVTSVDQTQTFVGTVISQVTVSVTHSECVVENVYSVTAIVTYVQLIGTEATVSTQLIVV